LHSRLIAFYLPQYHPIPENDAWWGKGFTEWTNVAKTRPLFPGHYQPHLPADLGYYDLRVPEVREAQAQLAREAGIEGFMYWHYWFGGKRLLERPFDDVLKSGRPDFPFCLGWANEAWTGIWIGRSEDIFIQQTYPGNEDHIRHFLALLPAFRDPRYITVEDKPVFVIYKHSQLPGPGKFIDLWQKLAVKNGLKGIYFVGLDNTGWDYQKDGFDGAIIENMGNAWMIPRRNRRAAYAHLARKLAHKTIRLFKKLPYILSYKEYVLFGLPNLDPKKEQYPLVMPNWDDSPRRNFAGRVFQGSTPELFRLQLLDAAAQVKGRDPEKQIIFIKSWNEWAEGNYLEPDQKFGKGYLDVIKGIFDGS
jgi:hypothetical protein